MRPHSATAITGSVHPLNQMLAMKRPAAISEITISMFLAGRSALTDVYVAPSTTWALARSSAYRSNQYWTAFTNASAPNKAEMWTLTWGVTRSPLVCVRMPPVR